MLMEYFQTFLCFWRLMSAEEKKTFCKDTCTSFHYMSSVANGRNKPSDSLKKLIQLTAGKPLSFWSSN